MCLEEELLLVVCCVIVRVCDVCQLPRVVTNRWILRGKRTTLFVFYLLFCI